MRADDKSLKRPHRGALPRLRFPGFSSVWTIDTLERICTINPSHAGLPTSFAYIDLGAVDSGELKEKRTLSRSEAPSRAQRLLKNGDILFQVVRPYQRNNLLFESDGAEPHVASTGYAQLRSDSSSRYLYHLVHSDGFVDRVVDKCTGTNYPAINSSDLAKILVAIPEPQERGKIAGCLSSVDELLAAEGRKLRALRVHKTALLQQLFPADGETIPRLRFPEFHNAPDWEAKQIREVVSRSFYGTSSPTSDRGTYPVLRMGNMANGGLNVVKLTFIDFSDQDFKKYALAPGDILLNRTNSIDLVGKVSLFDLSGDYVAASYLVAFRLKTEVMDPRFFNYILNSESYQFRIKGLATRAISQANINATAFQDRLLVSFPSLREQHAIADCLSSLDKLIAAQIQRIAALNKQKKGLMQQLFPVLDEVHA